MPSDWKIRNQARECSAQNCDPIPYGWLGAQRRRRSGCLSYLLVSIVKRAAITRSDRPFVHQCVEQSLVHIKPMPP